MPSIRELFNRLKAVVSTPALLYAATATGAAVDRAGYESVLCVMDAGLNIDGTWTLELQESDASDSGFTAVADADMQGPATLEPAYTTANDNAIHTVAYLGNKRYVRTVVTKSGGSTGMTFGTFFILGGARHESVQDAAQLP